MEPFPAILPPSSLSPDEACAEVYFALSECFKSPTRQFAAEVCGGTLQHVITEDFATLGVAFDSTELRIQGEAEAVWQGLKRAYNRLFVVPPRFVLPVESVFKDWAGKGGFLVGMRNLIMGPPAVDMLRRYRAAGFALPQSLKDYPDHLALLLEYGGNLIESGDRAARREFVGAHLDGWIEQFCDEVLALSPGEFYRSVVAALLAFATCERQALLIDN